MKNSVLNEKMGQYKNKEKNGRLSRIQWKEIHNIPKLIRHSVSGMLKEKDIAPSAYIQKWRYLILAT